MAPPSPGRSSKKRSKGGVGEGPPRSRKKPNAFDEKKKQHRQQEKEQPNVNDDHDHHVREGDEDVTSLSPEELCRRVFIDSTTAGSVGPSSSPRGHFIRPRGGRAAMAFLDKCEESGVMETVLWPSFVRFCAAAAAAEDASSAAADADAAASAASVPKRPTVESAHLLALLTNRRASARTGSDGSPLSYVVDDDAVASVEGLEGKRPEEIDAVRTAAFELLLNLLLTQHPGQQQRTGAGQGGESAEENDIETIRFLVSAYGSLDLRSSSSHKRILEKPLLDLVVGIGLWQYVPRRIRDLELRKNGLLRKRWGLYVAQRQRQRQQQRGGEEKGGGDDDDEEEEEELRRDPGGFLPRTVNRILRVLGWTPAPAAGEGNDTDAIGASGTAKADDEEEEEVPPATSEEDEDSSSDDDDGEDEEGEPLPRPAHPTPKKTTSASALRVPSSQALTFLASSLELLLDLLSAPSTRNHVRPYLTSINFAVRLTLSPLYRRSNNTKTAGGGRMWLKEDESDDQVRLFRQLVDMLVELERFGVDDDAAAAASGSGGGASVGGSADDGDPRSLNKSDLRSRLHGRASTLQKLCHRHCPDQALELIHAGVGRVCNRSYLSRQIAKWDDDLLKDVCRRLRLVGEPDEEKRVMDGVECVWYDDRTYLTEVMLSHHSSRLSEGEVLSSLPLYPTETLLWDRHLVPPGHVAARGGGAGASTLALPKINAEFLTYADYLLRSFKLLRLESAYGIRGDLVDAIKRMRPAVRHVYEDDEGGVGGDSMMRYGDDGEGDVRKKALTEFRGWAKMGLELASSPRVLRVSPPKLGETVPASVLAELVLDLKSCGASLKGEWDEVGEFDNLFLVSIDAERATGGPAPPMDAPGHRRGRGGGGSERRIPDEEDVTFPRRFGVVAVRGCMVLEVRDEAGTVLSDPAAAYEQEGGEVKAKGTKRFLRVALDPAQYAADATGRGSELGTGVYSTFNLVVRRHGRENNFKAVLETIRGLMQGTGAIHRSIPSWFHSVLLGYGDPSLASYTSRNMKVFATKTVGVTPPHAALDYGDTFLDERHLMDSFPSCKVLIDGHEGVALDAEEQMRKKFTVKVVDADSSHESKGDVSPRVVATSYSFPPGMNGNPIHFTPVQVQAIRSGLSPGLTLIVGPPGTGKTDVAVQIIANLYHSFPTQRTVIVTHSNAALNDLFDKVMARGDIEERYMLRLGAGERELQTVSTHDFTKTGRVAHILSRRSALLEKVQQLSESLGVSGAAERGADGSPSYTCETSGYFNLHHIQKRVHVFEGKIKDMKAKNRLSDENIGRIFPFKKYFGLDQMGLLMTLEDAKEKFNILETIFAELVEYRPLELLRSQRQRTDYLLTKQARIVAMTCTHAAIARSHLVELGFQYDNVLMEEAGQMLDVETFIPLLLQRGESDVSATASSRLKRVCLIGDHHQLPPVVKNMSFSKFSHLDQSLFSRLIRLGVPSIELNKQGRARPEIASLYSWRYRGLGNLDHVNKLQQFQKANAGFSHTFQVINVEEFEGRGETTPTAYFYQNVGEAEYAIALFQYMVLIGYPPEKISILTTYNGQKELLLDILSQRCGPGTPLAGVRPGSVSTVDHYQGQQNDYILLSLVRTRAVGHLRDIRRLVVAVSRARLGLYVFCRQKLFESCHELRSTMRHFTQRPGKLQLVTGEHFPSDRLLNGEIPEGKEFVVQDVTALGSIVHSMQEKLCSPPNQMEDVKG